jgi:hypothetical protein
MFESLKIWLVALSSTFVISKRLRASLSGNEITIVEPTEMFGIHFFHRERYTSTGAKWLAAGERRAITYLYSNFLM